MCKLSLMRVITCECMDGYTKDESGICLGELIFSTNKMFWLHYRSSMVSMRKREREGEGGRE